MKADQDKNFLRQDSLEDVLLKGEKEIVSFSYDMFIKELKIRSLREGKEFIEPAGLQGRDKH